MHTCVQHIVDCIVFTLDSVLVTSADFEYTPATGNISMYIYIYIYIHRGVYIYIEGFIYIYIY